MDIIGFKTLYDVLGIFNIKKNKYPSGFRYVGIIELVVPKNVRNSIIEILYEYNIHTFIIRNAITIKGNENIRLFLYEFSSDFWYKKDEVFILNKFIKHRCLGKRKRFDTNDKFYYNKLREIKYGKTK